jgi:2-dehydropantoate 2-reductase
MRYWVVGAGGIGCTMGARLAQSRDVVFVDTWEEHVDAINRAGLSVAYPDETVHVSVPAVLLGGLGVGVEPPDAVLLCVKSYETEKVMRSILPHLGGDAFVVSLQNCINEEKIAEIVGADRTIGAMVRFDGAILGPGRAAGTRRERRLAIGELDGRSTTRIDALRAELSASVQTDVSANIWGELWSKLVRNTEFNALSVIGRFGMGELVSNPTIRRVALAAGMETAAVALKQGIQLDETELDGPVSAYARGLGSPEAESLEKVMLEKFGPYPAVRASMLQDIEKGRPTEIEFMNGFVTRKGAELGVPAPVNQSLTEKVRSIERGELKLGRAEAMAYITSLHKLLG